MTETEQAMRKSPRETTDFDKALGAAIREARIAAGLSLFEIGKRADVTLQQILKYENGLNRLSAGRLMQIADALGVSAADLMERARGGAPAKPSRASLVLMREIENWPSEAIHALRDVARQMRVT